MIDVMTIIGLLLGASAVYIIMLHGQMVHLLFNLDALTLVLGGTIATIFIAYPWSTVKETPRAFGFIFFRRRTESTTQTIESIVRLCEKAKRNGIESLTNDIHNVRNKFLTSSVRMLIDGFEPEIVRGNMEKEINYIQERHQKVTSVFRMMGTVSPVFGLLGTLIGVVQVLRNITDPQAMGASMAIAVTTTFYGIFFANFIFLPIAVKLGEHNSDEVVKMELVTEGVESIQKGDVPVVCEKKLEVFLSMKLRERGSEKEKAK